MQKIATLAVATAMLFGTVANGTPTIPLASSFTVASNEESARLLAKLDNQDFDEARRGKIAEIPGGLILNAEGEPIWDMRAFDFVKGSAPPTVNPLLWRQAQLNAIHGLFEVVPGIYQLRGYDVAVMTLIRGKTGWIVVDPMVTEESARAAFRLAQEKLGPLPVRAFIFTHSHADHFGGAGGIASAAEIKAQDIRVIAPHGFAEHAVSENLLAGNAMNARTHFMFGERLARGPEGMVDAGIAKALAGGTTGLTLPTELVGPEGATLVIDGITFEFLDAAGSEAPSEFMFYLPEFKALCTAEVATKTMHNVLTMRGAGIRDPLKWSEYLDTVLQRYGGKAEVVFNSHHWPSWGRERVAHYLTDQRNLYRYINDQTLRQANAGATLHEMADQTPVPPMMLRDPSTRGYYGSLQHNIKATYQRYFGWWDGNPANFMPLPPAQSGPRYVELAGGANALAAKGQAALDAGEYRWAAELLNHLVMAEPQNVGARGLLATAYEQLGFQAEAASWRNYYLSAAAELRGNLIERRATDTLSPSFASGVPTKSVFDAFATRLDPALAGGRRLLLNFHLSDSNEVIGVTLADNVEFPNIGTPVGNPDASLRLDRAQLLGWLAGRLSTEQLLAQEGVRAQGEVSVFEAWRSFHPMPPRSFPISLP